MSRFATLSIVTLMLSGCATVETWEGLARARIVVKDISISCTNDAAYAVTITGEKYVSVVPSVVTCWNCAYVEQFDVCSSNGVRVITNECNMGEVCLTKSELNYVVVSGEQWMDENYLARGVLQGRNKCDFGIVIVDLNRWRRYLAVPQRKYELPSGREEWSFVVLDDPVIDFNGGFYVKNEINLRVILCRSIYTPLAVTFDVVTFPFQFCLGLFTHM